MSDKGVSDEGVSDEGVVEGSEGFVGQEPG